MPAEDTLETIFTSIVLAELVASVVTPVMIPFRYPVNNDVVPAPALGNTTLESDAVTPAPIVAPATDKFVVAIPTI